MVYPSLREEILDQAGLLTEDLLEEGFFKKAAVIALAIALLAGVALKGPAVKQSVQNYRQYSTMSVPEKYIEIDKAVNNEIANKLYTKTSQGLVTDYKKAEFLKSIVSNYVPENKQATIDIKADIKGSIRNEDWWSAQSVKEELSDVLDKLEIEILDALSSYVINLDNFRNKIEDALSPETAINKTNPNPLKIEINVEYDPVEVYKNAFPETSQKEYIANYLKRDLSQKIFEKTGTHLIIFKINGKEYNTVRQ